MKIRFCAIFVSAALAGCGSGGGSRGGGASTSQGLCVDSCPIRCGADRDCDTPGGELCCDLGDAGKVCAQAASCPRFCSADNRCDTARGEGCVRTTLVSQQRMCAQPGAGIRKCAQDSQCRSGEVCCGIYSEAVCVPAAACPKACAQSSQCNSGRGEICCTSLPKDKLALSAAGLCIYAAGCPKACASSADCDGRAGQLCCDGLCSTSCPKRCGQSSDCDRQICCDVALVSSPWGGSGIPTLPGGSVGGSTTSGGGGSTTGGMPLDGCRGYLTCINDGTRSQTECDDRSTDRAKTLLKALADCLRQECYTAINPATSMPYCASDSAGAACNDCYTRVLGAGGACADEVRNCQNDLP